RYQVNGTVSTVPTAGSTVSQAFYNVVVTDSTAGLTCTIGTVAANTTVTGGKGGTFGCVTSTGTSQTFFKSSSTGVTNNASVAGNRGSSNGKQLTHTATAPCTTTACPTNPGL